MEVNITEAGNYEIEGELGDQSGNEIENDVEFEDYFDIGLLTVFLSFKGIIINQHGEDGPYILEEIILSNIDEDIKLDELHNAHTTHAYNYTDFEHDLPDTIAPTIELISPKEDYTKRTSKSFYEIDFKFKVNDESNIESCSLIIDNKVEEIKTNIQKDIENVFSIKLKRGLMIGK